MRVPLAEQEKEGVLHVGQCPVCGHVWLPWNWKVTWLPPTPPPSPIISMSNWIFVIDFHIGIYLKLILGKSKFSSSFVGILEDISWRKQAEESLQRSEERYVLAVKGSNDGLWDYDMTAKKVFYSPRYKHMLRLDLTEIDDSFDVFESRLHPSYKGRSIRFFIVSPLSFPLVFC